MEVLKDLEPVLVIDSLNIKSTSHLIYLEIDVRTHFHFSKIQNLVTRKTFMRTLRPHQN